MSELDDVARGLDELSRLAALQVRLAIGNQTQTILELDRLGFSTRRIAELLGTTNNTANVTIQKAKKKGKTEPNSGVARGGESGA